MIDRRKMLGLFGLPMLSLAGCGSAAKHTYRYKLTLAVETPDGVKSSFNVVERSEYKVKYPHSGVRGSTTGEALYLDLGANRKPLIGLLTRRVGSSVEPYFPNEKTYFGVHYEWAGDRNPGLEALARSRGAKTLAMADLPELVTFPDPANPKTVMAVDPKDLQATLGPGITWRRMTIEITDDPVTTGIEQKLPWLTKVYSTMLDGRRPGQGHDQILAAKLNSGDFLSKGN
jgi:hypothetical protein